ncbi:class I SAM-dependent methyltransferase [Rhodococcus opacus]|uniref:class I SAM-dependent methyltransferase n=1 Tax=Rhodococcus opacus TaxID=37919 RepID=UPI0034D34F49
MTNNRVAAVYERLWRPIVVAALSLHGLSVADERARAAAALHLDGGEQRVLDVACGPGNFTGFFADRLAGDGFVIGLDTSPPMLERAVHDNPRPRARSTPSRRRARASLPSTTGRSTPCAASRRCTFPRGGAVCRAPRDGAGVGAGWADRGDDQLRSRIPFLARKGPRAGRNAARGTWSSTAPRSRPSSPP